MNPYLICYDFHTDKNYTPLWNNLRQMGSVRLQESVWLLESALGVAQLRNLISSMIDTQDSVAVLELKPGSTWATVNVNGLATQWLSGHVLQADAPPANILLGYGPALPISGRSNILTGL